MNTKNPVFIKFWLERQFAVMENTHQIMSIWILRKLINSVWKKHIFASICFFELKIIFIFLKIYLRKERLINQHCSGIIYSTNYQKIIKIQIYRIIIKKTKRISIFCLLHTKKSIYLPLQPKKKKVWFSTEGKLGIRN